MSRSVVCYVCHNPQFPGWNGSVSLDHPGFDVYSAIVRFDGVGWLQFGPPNDETLAKHPLYTYGLRQYGFWEVLDSPKKRVDKSKRHWIATFHDETLEVLADSSTMISTRIEGEETAAILDRYVSSGAPLEQPHF